MQLNHNLKRSLMALAAAAAIIGIWVVSNFLYSPKLSTARISQAYSYCKSHGMSTRYCVFVDFGIHSGHSRFMVYDYAKKEIIIKALCPHGDGSGNYKSTASKPVFSNVNGSCCSSLGHYKIGGGTTMATLKEPAFFLYGLDKSNSNARKRDILIHPYKGMDIFTAGVYPFHLPMHVNYSWGCFVLSHYDFNRVRNIINSSSKPIMLWAYYQ